MPLPNHARVGVLTANQVARGLRLFLEFYNASAEVRSLMPQGVKGVSDDQVQAIVLGSKLEEVAELADEICGFATPHFGQLALPDFLEQLTALAAGLITENQAVFEKLGDQLGEMAEVAKSFKAAA